MKELLKQILEGEQIYKTCVLVPEAGWLWGYIQAIEGNILIFNAEPNKHSGRYWTSVVNIDKIIAMDFRSDTRPLAPEEREELGLPIETQE